MTPKSDTVIRLLRLGDRIGHRQQPQQVHIVIKVEEQALLTGTTPEQPLQFVALQDIAPPF